MHKNFKGSLDSMNPEDVGNVTLALNDQRWSYRTINGIEEQTNIDPLTIEGVLDPANGIARISWLRTKDDQTLYRPAATPLSGKEKIEMVRRILAKDVKLI